MIEDGDALTLVTGMATSVHVRLSVDNLWNSVRFYLGVLELTLVTMTDDAALFYVGHSRLYLSQATAAGKDDVLAPTRSGQSRVGISVRSADLVDRFERQAREARCEIVVPASDRDRDRRFICLDPSGNQVEVFYDGMFPSGNLPDQEVP